jgi:hypothetical protein
MRRFIERQAFEITEHDGRAKGAPQAVDLAMQGLGLFALDERSIGRRAGPAISRRLCRFVVGSLTASDPAARLASGLKGDAIQPSQGPSKSGSALSMNAGN